jgi:hypothetical protein
MITPGLAVDFLGIAVDFSALQLIFPGWTLVCTGLPYYLPEGPAMRTVLLSVLFIACCAICHPARSNAEQTSLRSIGVRGGVSAISTDKFFHQYEAFAVCKLPWELRSGSGFGVASLLDVSAGALRGEGHTGFIGSAGPAFSLGKTGFPLEMDIGVSAAALSRDTFGNRDFYGNVQFISHVGVNLRFTRQIGCGYRLQHMSNAGLNSGGNPGLNMHLLELNWYFAP